VYWMEMTGKRGMSGILPMRLCCELRAEQPRSLKYLTLNYRLSYRYVIDIRGVRR
jgi:hypothetical protein